jgi:hypothetical protein
VGSDETSGCTNGSGSIQENKSEVGTREAGTDEYGSGEDDRGSEVAEEVVKTPIFRFYVELDPEESLSKVLSFVRVIPDYSLNDTGEYYVASDSEVFVLPLVFAPLRCQLYYYESIK